MSDTPKRQQPTYSGPASRRFWRRITALKNQDHNDAAYTLAVVLQELEARTLQSLKVFEQKQRQARKATP